MNINIRLRSAPPIKLRYSPGATGPAGEIISVDAITLPPGSDATVVNNGTQTAAELVFGVPEGDKGDKGDTGDKGWSPQLATPSDGVRRVHQIAGWTGGQGTPPTSGQYLGPSGLVTDIGDATDIRGPAGTATIPNGDKGDITTSNSGDTWQINAGAVGTSELADGALSADAPGRGKMAAKYVQADKIDDDAVIARLLSDSVFGARSGMINGTFTGSRSSNAETWAVKTLAGNDPSAADPVYFVFQNGSGGFVVRSVTAALSVTASSGSTIGTSNNVAFRLWTIAADDAGTVRLGIIKTASGTDIVPLSEAIAYSSLAEGGAGAADSAQIIYSGTAFSSKYICLVGYSDWESGLATAGTWNSAPTRRVLFGQGVRRPGDVVRTWFVEDATYQSTTSVIPNDDTLPQVSEGAQIATLSVTFSSAANIYRLEATAVAAASALANSTVAAFSSASTNALASVYFTHGGANYTELGTAKKRDLCATTSALTFQIRFGPAGAQTIYLNGTSVGRRLGGSLSCTLGVEELMA